MRSKHRMQTHLVSGSVSLAPAGERGGSVFPAVRRFPPYVEFDCKGCKWNKSQYHPAHTHRAEPPNMCRYPDTDYRWITCPGCKADRSSDHPSHTHDEGCRQPLVAVTGVRRKGGPIRAPAMRAHGESADRRMQNADHDFDASRSASSRDDSSSYRYLPPLPPPASVASGPVIGPGIHVPADPDGDLVTRRVRARRPRGRIM